MFEQIGTVLARALNGEVRASVPVRRHSFELGHCEATFWRQTNWREVQCILLAAKRYERIERRPGHRNGPLGSVAIEVLEYLVNVVDFDTGRLEPAIDTMALRVKRSKDAVVRGLANLRRHGFLDWIRRYESTGNEGAGPRVRQASNAYRLLLPERGKRVLSHYGRSVPVPVDFEQAESAREEEVAIYRKSLSMEELARSVLGDTDFGQKYARLGRLIDERKLKQERESAGRDESRSESIKPAPE